MTIRSSKLGFSANKKFVTYNLSFEDCTFFLVNDPQAFIMYYTKDKMFYWPRYQLKRLLLLRQYCEALNHIRSDKQNC